MNKFIVIAGNMFTSFGNSMYVVALLIFITKTSPHPFSIGLIQAAAYLPIVLFGVSGGLLADRMNRPRIIAGTDMIRSVLLIAAALGIKLFTGINPLIIFLPLVFLNAVMQAFFSPAVISFIFDQKKGKTDLLSLRTGTGHLSAFLGQIIGSALFPVYGLIPLLLINSLCFFVSGTSELFLREAISRKKGTGVPRISAGKNLIDLSKEFLSLDKKGAPILLYLGMQAVNSIVVLNLPFLLTKRLGFNFEFIGYGLAGLLGGSILSGLFLGLSGTAGRVGAKSAIGASLLFAFLCTTASLIPEKGSTFLSFLLPLMLLILAGACQGWIHLVTIHLVNKLGRNSSNAGRQGFLESTAAAVLPLSYIISAAVASFLPLDTPWLLRAAAIITVALSVKSLKRLPAVQLFPSGGS